MHKNIIASIIALTAIACASLPLDKSADVRGATAATDANSADLECAAIGEATTETVYPAAATEDYPDSISDIVLNLDAGCLTIPGYVADPSGYDIPIEVNDEVKRWILFLKGPHAKHFRIWLERSGAYEKFMKEMLAEAGMPQDLFYIALIESGFNPRVKSRAGAVGAWQFMPRTGRAFGLNADFFRDDRRDPVMATEAAIKYFRQLYGMFGDWKLAAASYNAGENKIKRAIKKTGTDNFWEIAKTRYIRNETKNYVPKWFAGMMMAKHPEVFGFEDLEYEEPWEFELITVDDATDINVIAQAAGVSANDIKRLNPQLYRWFTPPGKKYKLRTPKGSAERFYTEYAKIPTSKRVTFRRHRVRQGETLSEIGEAYKTSVREIMSLNHIRSARLVRAGSDLIVPVRPSFKPPPLEVVRARQVKKRAKPLKIYDIPGKEMVSYVVARGDVIGKLADMFEVSVADLIKWNELDRRGTIYRGRRIVAYVDPQIAERFEPPTAILEANKKAAEKRVIADYVVESGDTLWSISVKYGCPLQKIYDLNGFHRRTRIHPGDTIMVEVSESEAAGLKRPGKQSRKKAEQLKQVSYRIKSGDSLWSIADSHDVELADLMTWNNLSRRSKLMPGQKITIYTD